MQIIFGTASLPVLHNAIRRAAARRTAFDAGTKVWLVDVAAELRLPVASLAAELLRLMRAGQLELSRCDLPFLAPAGVVDASQIGEGGLVEFHLVRIAA